MGKFRPIVHEIWDPPSPAPLPPRTVKACRKDVQRRLRLLSATNEAARSELIARDLLLRRCRDCGDCWLARL